MKRDNNIEVETPIKEASGSKETNFQAPKRFPRSVFFIIGNEFCER